MRPRWQRHRRRRRRRPPWPWLGLVLIAFISACAHKSVYEPRADREGIKGVVRQRFHEVEACYLDAIEKRPGAEGKVVMSWEIQPDGRVASVRMSEAGAKIDVIGPCLTDKIRNWRFPKLTSGEVAVEVNYPFFFSENGDFTADRAK